MKKPKKALDIWEKVQKRRKAQNFSKKPLLFFEGRKRPNWPEKAHHGNTIATMEIGENLTMLPEKLFSLALKVEKNLPKTCMFLFKKLEKFP